MFSRALRTGTRLSPSVSFTLDRGLARNLTASTLRDSPANNRFAVTRQRVPSDPCGLIHRFTGICTTSGFKTKRRIDHRVNV